MEATAAPKFNLTCVHSEYENVCCSNFEGDAVNELDLGDEVEYTLAKKTNKVSAEWIRKLPTSVRG